MRCRFRSDAKRGLRSERGAVAVEFAIILPVLMLLILGGMDLGHRYYIQYLTTNPSREGARYAAKYTVTILTPLLLQISDYVKLPAGLNYNSFNLDTLTVSGTYTGSFPNKIVTVTVTADKALVDTWKLAGIYQPKDSHSHYGYERGALKGTEMPNRRAKKKLTLVLDESGAVAIVIAIAFAVLCGFVGLAFDIGHMVMVKAELQRTADAGCLGRRDRFGALQRPGAKSNAKLGSSDRAKAHTIINNAANKADNQIFTITDGTVQYGYWLLKPPTDYVTTTTTHSSPN